MREQLSGPAPAVAPTLLGATLLSELGGDPVSVRLTEVEAYAGADDPASHAYRGRTKRTEVMFGPPGQLYCYFVYGMHWCVNIVTGPAGQPSAVLLRAAVVLTGVDVARARASSVAANEAKANGLARGPARLARALGLTGAHTGLDLLSESSPVRLMAPGVAGSQLSGPRVGVSAAAERPWRFWIAGDASVSKFRAGGPRGARPTRQTDPL